MNTQVSGISLADAPQVGSVGFPGPKGDVGDVNPQMPILVAAAEDAAAAADVSAQAAQSAQTGAEAARGQAQTAQAAAEAARDTASGHATTATTQAGIATTKAAEAAASATAAATSKDQAAVNAALAIDYMNYAPRFRGIRNLLDAHMPVSLLPQTCMLQKLRATTYTEFAFYWPINPDGKQWARSLFSDRFNGVLGGSIRHITTTLAYLYQSSAKALITENQTTGTETPAPSATVSTSSGVRVGTFTGPTTVGGVSDIAYSTAVGDTTTYTVTNASRIEARMYGNTSNGGVLKYTVKEGGVEVASGSYSQPAVSGDRLINLALLTGLHYVTLATGLDTSKTYEVQFTVHSTNAAGKRGYEGGLRVWNAPLSVVTAGVNGTFASKNTASGTMTASWYPGARFVRQFTGTRFKWKTYRDVTNGQVEVRVYNSSGVEVSSSAYQSGTTIDLYGTGVTFGLAEFEIVKGLASGIYYVVITALPTKNASSSGYIVYDNGAVSYDETAAGVMGVDAFDDMGVSQSISAITACPAGTILFGVAGNLEQAIEARRPTDAIGTQVFCGGSHGNESAAAGIQMVFDGVDITASYAAAANLSTFTGKRFVLSHQTSLKVPLDSSLTWANNEFRYQLSAAGFTSQAKRTTTRDMRIYSDYALMHHWPSRQSGTLGAGGGFDRVAVDGEGNFLFNTYVSSATEFTRGQAGAAAYNDDYIVYGVNLDGETYRRHYASGDVALSSGRASFLQGRTDQSSKFYNLAFKYDTVNGRLVASGDSYIHVNHYRAFASGCGFGLLAGTET